MGAERLEQRKAGPGKWKGTAYFVVRSATAPEKSTCLDSPTHMPMPQNKQGARDSLEIVNVPLSWNSKFHKLCSGRVVARQARVT